MTEATTKPALRIILVDDHELVRSGIRALLSILAGIEVVAEARDGGELMRVLQAVPADMVLCDIAMPGMDGLEAIERIHREWPQIRTLVLSMDDSATAARRAISKGASGYIVKQAATAELEAAIRTTAAGGRYLSPMIARQLLEAPADTPEEQLTVRQMEILTLIAQGRSARDIGERLGLSSKTVDVHRSRIMDRLGIHDVAGLTRYAIKHRLVR
jgi:DNA-binding NarL/FixJ family response regulator